MQQIGHKHQKWQEKNRHLHKHICKHNISTDLDIYVQCTYYIFRSACVCLCLYISVPVLNVDEGWGSLQILNVNILENSCVDDNVILHLPYKTIKVRSAKQRWEFKTKNKHKGAVIRNHFILNSHPWIKYYHFSGMKYKKFQKGFTTKGFTY